SVDLGGDGRFGVGGADVSVGHEAGAVDVDAEAAYSSLIQSVTRWAPGFRGDVEGHGAEPGIRFVGGVQPGGGPAGDGNPAAWRPAGGRVRVRCPSRRR